jgi:hypothetical protein
LLAELVIIGAIDKDVLRNFSIALFKVLPSHVRREMQFGKWWGFCGLLDRGLGIETPADIIIYELLDIYKKVRWQKEETDDEFRIVSHFLVDPETIVCDGRHIVYRSIDGVAGTEMHDSGLFFEKQ